MADERRAWSEADRAAYREFVRTHHPDVGGDPAEFAAGLREFHDRAAATASRSEEPGPDAPVIFVTRQRGLPRIVSAFSARRQRKRNPRVR
ncbi:J domain-containing protein [Amycolatopsis jiangsuensis]|uniref:J domain-containing protein n=1 Tax=Amycolatopsis jiangsuensis TaxID=1181879 RepID=A0A840IPF7_9PSEU|nr:hypothetical protein [Amycolatopsis jiangsuensis]MBB4684256.1 hypothetical protein [Amycolatopsis jiangsuensis]